MKQILTLISFLLLTTGSLKAQINELALIYNWDDPDIVGSSFYENKYNEVWGVVKDGSEYAIIGSTDGTHFFNMDDISETEELQGAFVEGKATGGAIIHRDFHDYNGYLYAVADEGPSSLQIIKMANLPNSTELVYDSDALLRTTHNIFIDTSSALLYAMGGRAVQGGNTIQFALRILSLDDPENPTVVNTLPNQDLNLPYVHDGYIENGIAYFNCGYDGFYVVDFTDPENPTLLGSMTDYPDSGYNHSGWLHETEPVYYLADENHGLRIKVVDVSDFSDMAVVNFIDAETDNPGESIPHNMIVMDNYLYVSYYFDGVQVYDISDAFNPVRVAAYDTYPIVDFSDDYNGNWGVYPFPGSKRLVASDMRNGLFAFEAYNPSNTKETVELVNTLKVSPNPIIDRVKLLHDAFDDGPSNFNLYDVNAKLIYSSSVDVFSGQTEIEIMLPDAINQGVYIFELLQKTKTFSGKLIK